MKNPAHREAIAVCLTLSVFFAACVPGFAEQAAGPGDLVPAHGGLVVQIGADDVATAAVLSETGRFVVNVLDADAATVEAARGRIRAEGHYGFATANILGNRLRLPYAENLVNVALVRNATVPASELFRVLTPGGAAVISGAGFYAAGDLRAAGFDPVAETSLPGGGTGLTAVKPRPEAMDSWSHPRHGADGNAVSRDTLVGPPERVRWIAAATKEVEGLVTSGGRNFYGGVLARDSFNGLRLWHYDLKSAELNANPYSFPRLEREGARPVAQDKYLIAVVKGRLVALDAVTGESVRDYAEVTTVSDIVCTGDAVIISGENSVRAFATETAEELWAVESVNPRNLVASDQFVTFIQGNLKRGDAAEAVTMDVASGKELWRRSDYAWLNKVTRTVLHEDQIAFEVSTFNDHDLGNALHIVSAETGAMNWMKAYPPGMNHTRQARAMFLDDGLWILHGGKVNTAEGKENIKRIPTAISALDPKTGETMVTHPAGMAHCFPPVATPNFMFAGELDMTDLKSGKVVANRITKANCSRENGWVPANGLVYTTPKHCTCWPMLRGYVSMAPRGSETEAARWSADTIDYAIERGTAKPDPSAKAKGTDWPQYRHDQWRSGGTASSGPGALEVRWTTALAAEKEAAIFAEPAGPIAHDWNENPYVKGPVSAPTVANGLVYVTRPNAHEVVALDADSGVVRWRFTADGRVDTPPAVHRGLCLFGSLGGSVYALRADTGELVWRRESGATRDRMVAYGQVESPWPVSGAVLVIDDTAYYAAGRQVFADGGVNIFAIDPMTGAQKWVHRIDSLPQSGYYENSGLEFDPIDILHQEGDRIAMSRWLVTRDGKDISVDKWDGFAKIDTGKGAAYVPRGSWSYGARHVHRFPGEARRRPLTVVRDGVVFSSLNGTNTVFRRDFTPESVKEFSRNWITGWEASKTSRAGGSPYRSYRLAEEAAWKSDHFTPAEERGKEVKIGTQLYNDLHAMALAGDGRLFVAHKDGRMKVIAVETGEVVQETRVPAPAWDGMAIANGRVYLSTQAGGVICLGDAAVVGK